jgi:hypothetical protein
MAHLFFLLSRWFIGDSPIDGYSARLRTAEEADATTGTALSVVTRRMHAELIQSGLQFQAFGRT